MRFFPGPRIIDVMTLTGAVDDAPPEAELVVLLHPDGRPAGTAVKATVHHGDTPLHLAFSCYVFDAADRLLVTRRALSKATFPGIWTNSVCGHPQPGEHLADAARRRALRELGLHLDEPRLLLPAFAYRAEMDGVVEAELCPVLLARCNGEQVTARADEVADHRWIAWPQFRDGVRRGRLEVSPWCRDQVDLLADLPDDVGRWPARSAADLPVSAVW